MSGKKYEAGTTHKFPAGSLRIADQYIDWEGIPQYIIEVTLFNGTVVYPLIWSTTKLTNAIEGNYKIDELFPGITRSLGLDEIGYGAKIVFNGKVETVVGILDPRNDKDVVIYVTFDFEGESHQGIHRFPLNVRLEKVQ